MILFLGVLFSTGIIPAIQAAEHSVVAQQQQFAEFEIDYGRLFHHKKFTKVQFSVPFFHDHIADPFPVLIQNAPVAAVAVFMDGGQRAVLMGSRSAYRVILDFTGQGTVDPR